MYLKDKPGWVDEWFHDWLATEHGKEAMERVVQEEMEKVVQKEMEKVKSQVLQEGLQKGIQEGMQKGIQKGIKQGLERGMENGKVEVMRRALLTGIDTRTVAQITGFSEDMVRKFQKGLKIN